MQPATQAWWFAAGRLLATVLIGLRRRAGCSAIPGAGWPSRWRCTSRWVLANLFRLEWWLRHRSYADPPDVGGVWGEIIAQIVRLHRRKRFHKQRFVQLMRQLQRSTAALPDGVVILNAQREIVWFNRMAARLLDLRRTADLGLRIENLLREPEFVRYLAGGEYANPVVIRPATGRGQLPVAAGRPLRRRPAAAAGARRVAADAPGGDAQGLRRQRLARAALAAHGDLRLPRDAGAGSGARCGPAGARSPRCAARPSA